MPSTHFHRDAPSVAAPEPLSGYEKRRTQRRQIEVIVGPGDEVTTAEALIAAADAEADAFESRQERKGGREAFLAGYLRGVVEQLCFDLHAAQRRPGLLKARLAARRRAGNSASNCGAPL